MARKKVDLTYIANDSKRKATLRKRKNGLIKKVDEISILCGIEACAIIYVPENPTPEVWPSDWGVQNVLSRFRGVSELEQSKKMLSQESFLRHRIIKAQEQLKKLKAENRKKEMTLNIYQYFNASGNIFDSANMIYLNDIAHMTTQNLQEIDRKINRDQQPQDQEVVAPVVPEGGEIMAQQGEQAQLVNDHVQVPEANNVNAVGNQDWPVEMINGADGDQMLTMDDVNLPSGWLNQYIP
ncbi:agamous-like MADS-box protein AGL80 [Cajanus cajan]|uniref:Agamous-like MADS-box protein AGL80 n=1 Tax=Cajanus cajan TaxID=3821 RepID=A0A151RPQ4_CAJCA|nr:agamous-like MADS-box protein AGL80 [Cajanus cajan]KYP44515.1 Agamous-like MADS-box protein AGL80 [Cajanus cajan]